MLPRPSHSTSALLNRRGCWGFPKTGEAKVPIRRETRVPKDSGTLVSSPRSYFYPTVAFLSSLSDSSPGSTHAVP